MRLGDDAGMGHRALAYTVINRSKERCSLRGYPALTPLDAGGRTIDSIPVTQVEADYLNPLRKVHTVILRAGKQAWFEIGYSVIPHGNASCPQVRKLRLQAPGTRYGTEFVQAMKPCDGIQILPLQASPPDY